MTWRWPAVLTVLALAVGCSNGGKDDGTVNAGGGGGGGGASATTTSGPGVTSAPTTSTIPLAAYRTFGTPKSIATTGFVVGTSYDGSALYVLGKDPSRTVPDCVGTRPADVLYRVSLTGGPDEAVKAGSDSIPGQQVVRAPGGAGAPVAVFKYWASDGCPGSDAKIYAGTETADGHLRDLRLVPTQGLETLDSIDWTVDGKNLLVYKSASKRAGDPWPVSRLDPATGTVTKLFDVPGPLTAIRQLADGSYIFDHGNQVTLNDSSGAVVAKADGNLRSISPDRKSAVVVNPNGTQVLQVLMVGQTAPTALASADAGKQLGGVAYSPDGRAVAYTLTGSGNTAPQAVVLTIADKQTAPVATAGSVSAFAGDGKRLVLSGPTAGAITVIPLGGT